MGDSRTALVETFFEGTGASYDFMVNAATFGCDRLWKRSIVAAIPREAGRVLDLACGTGISTMAIARALPRAHVVGVELREEYLAIARDKVRKAGLGNVELVLSRAEDYVADAPFDCVASSYLAKYADLPLLTANSLAMLNPGGVLLMHDFVLPPQPWLLRTWRLYFRLLQRWGVRMFPAWREIYFGLPQLIERTNWVDDLHNALRTNRFEQVRMEYLAAYGSAMVTAKRSSAPAVAVRPRRATG